jgi:XTP/dITP diphosphohydrolase
VIGQGYRYSELTFVSCNKDKYEEYRRLLGISDLRWSTRDLNKSQNVSVSAIAEEKIRDLIPQMRGIPFFVEHSGLVIESWRNLPGGLAKVFLENIGNEGICRMMRAYDGEDRAATAVVVIGFHSPDGRTRTFRGERRGRIAEEPSGSNNFGWDPIFIPDGQRHGQEKSYAEMSLDEKNCVSMRRAASEEFLRYISRLFVI